MSHEIRTSMNGIINMSNFLSQTKLNTKQTKYIETIKNSSKALLHIVNDILDINKTESGKLELNYTNFDIVKLLIETEDLLKYKAIQKGLIYETQILSKLPKEIYADRLRISQILINIISNSIKFTHNGYIKIKILFVNNRLKFTIIDTGIGISKENQTKLFDPFVQVSTFTSEQYEGSGLGLTITKQLLTLMNGTIKVKSKVDIGTIFKINIPIKDINKEMIITEDTNIITDDVNFLYTELLEVVQQHRSKNCKLVLDKFTKYKLSAIDSQNHSKLTKFITNRAFNKCFDFLKTLS
jgi:signal transduction histidine kinase